MISDHQKFSHENSLNVSKLSDSQMIFETLYILAKDLAIFLK